MVCEDIVEATVSLLLGLNHKIWPTSEKFPGVRYTTKVDLIDEI
jgi:hypothetical protein